MQSIQHILTSLNCDTTGATSGRETVYPITQFHPRFSVGTVLLNIFVFCVAFCRTLFCYHFSLGRWQILVTKMTGLNNRNNELFRKRVSNTDRSIIIKNLIDIDMYVRSYLLNL